MRPTRTGARHRPWAWTATSPSRSGCPTSSERCSIHRRRKPAGSRRPDLPAWSPARTSSASASLRGRERAFEEAPVAETLRARRERRLRSAPAQLVDVADDLGRGPQRREILEQQRELALVPEHLGRELLQRPVLVDEPRRRDLADAGDAGIAVGRVADERQE